MSATASQSAPRMLRSLRVKFMAVNMALAFIVLLVAFTTICALDYRSSLDEVNASLNNAVEHAADDPLRAFQDELFGAMVPGRDAQDRTLGGSDYGEGFVPPQIGGKHGQRDDEVPVATYYVSSLGIYQMMGKSSASVSDSMLGAAISQALDSSEASGYLAMSDLYFAKSVASDGAVIAFADGSTTRGWQGLAWGLAGIGAVALLVLFAFNLLFSRWALRPVQRAWEQQQRFIADASHELKTPLTVILANSAILQRERDETVASQMQWIESTRVEAERMQGLVTDMLDLARSDATGEAAAKFDDAQPVSLSRVVEGEALTFEAVAYERGVEWEADVQPDLMVAGDVRQLQRLVSVLLDNACKYVPAHGSVRVMLDRDGQLARLRVTNSGDPIAPEDLAHVFDRFYRADKARTHHGDGEAPDGYGLGLSIAQLIAQAHGGTLEAASSAADGTTFTLTLPLA